MKVNKDTSLTTTSGTRESTVLQKGGDAKNTFSVNALDHVNEAADFSEQEEDLNTRVTGDPDEIAEEDANGTDEEFELDVPGSELDDEQEDIGSEDEENNYYSLGGDNHNDLEEDNI